MESELERILGKTRLEMIEKMSLNSKLSTLREVSEGMPNGADLAVLQRHIVKVMSEQRSSFDFATLSIAPEAYDVLISDITPGDLTKIGEELESTALSETEAEPAFPVMGIVFGNGQRIFVPLIVAKRGKSINVNFLYDTGSPNSYLRRETLAALGFGENTPSETNVVIHGTALTVYLSSNHFENVDLLGQDFFRAIRGLVTIDYPMSIVQITTK